jgi:hypothetical protein
MVTAITDALAANPAGVVSVRFPDGRSIQYDRAQALKELAYWENKVNTQARGGMTMSRCKLIGDA